MKSLFAPHSDLFPAAVLGAGAGARWAPSHRRRGTACPSAALVEAVRPKPASSGAVPRFDWCTFPPVCAAVLRTRLLLAVLRTGRSEWLDWA